MCKKLLVPGLIVAASLFLLRKTDVGSLASVWWSDAMTAVDKQVPPEVRLKQLVAEVDKIDADIKGHLGRLADQVVAYEKLERQVQKQRETQQTRRQTISDLTVKLEQPGDRAVTRTLTSKLDDTVTDFESRKGELRGLEELLKARKEALDVARQKIAVMREQKEELRVATARLEARLELARLKQVEGKLEIDLTQVNRCNQLASKLESDLRRMEVQTDLLVENGFTAGSRSKAHGKSPQDVVKAAKQALADEDVAARD